MAKYNFCAETEYNNIVNSIRNFFDKNNTTANAIIGISGGKDSTMVARLCVDALGADRVIGVLMPNGEQEDLIDAVEICECLKIKYQLINIEDMVNIVRCMLSFAPIYQNGHPLMINTRKSNDKNRLKTECCYDDIRNTLYNISEQAKINLPARIRMTALYAIAQSNNGFVMNTCNLCEDWVGYSTKYGDAAGDFSPLANYTVEEILMMGNLPQVNIPRHLLFKTPSDGLCGQTDEEKLGFTYQELSRYIRTGEIENVEHKNKIDKLHKQNLFKLLPMETCKNNLIVAI